MKIDDFISNNENLGIKKMSDREKFFVYIISDSESNIIYVGKTISLYTRIIAHRKRMDVNSVYFFETTKENHIPEEQRLIKELLPKYNITLNPNGTVYARTPTSNKSYNLKPKLLSKKIKALGFTIREFSRELKIPYGDFQLSVDRNRIGGKGLKKLTDYFNCTQEYLMIIGG